MSVSLNDRPNKVTIAGDAVTVTTGAGVQGPKGDTGAPGVGGAVAYFGNFFSTDTQTNGGATVANVFTLNSTVDANGVSIVDGSKITFAAGSDGTYDLQFSVQFDKTDSGTDEVDVWLSKNGSNEDWSNTKLSLVGNDAKVVAAWNFQLNDVVGGDYFELYWWSPDTAVRALAEAAGSNPTRPQVPSIILTVAQVTYTQVGATGPQGPAGPGVPIGGTTGQVLAKTSNTDYATAWVSDADGAPTNAQYVTLATNGTLTDERVLTAGTGISLVDGGAGAAVTVATSAILPTIVDAKGDLIVGTAADTVARLAVGATDGHILKVAAAETTGLLWQGQSEVIVVAISDETTVITTGTAKVTFRMPFAMTLTAVRASLSVASSSGLPTFDINEGGSTILSTKITIDANETTSTTAATPPVISDTALADDAEISIDIDVAGTGAKGAKVYLIGRRT